MLNYDWLDECCLSKQAAEKDYKPEWDATRYMIRGKMFTLQSTNPTRLFSRRSARRRKGRFWSRSDSLAVESGTPATWVKYG